MTRKSLLLGTLPLISSALALAATPELRVHEVLVPSEHCIPYAGSFKELFPDGLAPAVGFGLTTAGKDPTGLTLLLTTTGPGPTATAPDFEDDKKATRPARAFLAPTFTPSVAILALTERGALVKGLLPLLSADGRPLSGLPPASRKKGERPLSVALAPLKAEGDAIDPKAVALDAGGALWVADEYGPSLMRFDRESGRLLFRYAPGSGLPEILDKRRPGRGFSSITITPSGRVLAALQGVLDATGKYKESKAALIRLVELEPTSGRVRMLAYPHDVESYRASSDGRVDALHALSDTELLLVESGRGRDKSERIVLYRVNLQDATDITGVTAGKGRPLEALESAVEIEKLGVRLARKIKLLDLVGTGWPKRGVDGLTLLEDRRTLIASSAGDGIESHIEHPAKRKSGGLAASSKDYVIDERGRMSYNDELTNARWAIRPSGKRSLIGVIRLTEPLTP